MRRLRIPEFIWNGLAAPGGFHQSRFMFSRLVPAAYADTFVRTRYEGARLCAI